MSWIRSLERPLEGRLLAGVCAALAGGLRVDATLLRLAMLVLALASGLGLLVYAALWVLLPSEGAGRGPWRAEAWASVRGMRAEIARAVEGLAEAWSRSDLDRWPLPLGRRWTAAALIAGGSLLLLCSLGLFAWLGLARALGLAAILLGAAVLFTMASGRRE